MDDEDTIELTITRGLFKKHANYFVGVRMLGHAGKVKTELVEDTDKPKWQNNTFAFAVPEGRLTPDTELVIRFGAFIALKDTEGNLCPPKLLGQCDVPLHDFTTRLLRGETLFESIDLVRDTFGKDVGEVTVGRISILMHLIGVGDGVVAGAGSPDNLTINIIARRAEGLPLRGGSNRPPDALLECRIVSPQTERLMRELDKARHGLANVTVEQLEELEIAADAILPVVASETAIVPRSQDPVWNEILVVSVSEDHYAEGYFLRFNVVDPGVGENGVILASTTIPFNMLQGMHDYNVGLQCWRRTRYLDRGTGKLKTVGAENNESAVSTILMTVSARESIAAELRFFGGNPKASRLEVFIEGFSSCLESNPVADDIIAVVHLITAGNARAYEQSLHAMVQAKQMPPLPYTCCPPSSITCRAKLQSFNDNLADHSVMQSLLKVTPAAIMNARNKPRWEYTVQFHTGINHDGFDHYPNAGQKPALIFMFFAKERDVPATLGEHKLIGYSVTPVPSDIPTNGQEIKFRSIPVQPVKLHFKPSVIDEEESPFNFSIKMRFWESETFCHQLMTGEHGAGEMLSSGVANWMAAAAKLGTGSGGSALAKLAQTAQAKKTVGGEKGVTSGMDASLNDVEAKVAEKAIEKTKRKEQEKEAKRVADEYESHKKIRDAEAAKTAEETQKKANIEKKLAEEKLSQQKAKQLEQEKLIKDAQRVAAEEARRKKEKKLKEEEEVRRRKEKNDAAIKIQSIARSRAANHRVKRMKEEEAARKKELNDKDRQRIKMALSYISSYRAICDENIVVAEQHEKEAEELRKLSGASNITVAARFRPLVAREKDLGSGQISNGLKVAPTLGQEVQYRSDVFTFDFVYGTESTQEMVYNGVGKKIIDSMIAGFNGTIFAYGQTGSGKTFSMFGAGSEGSSTEGIVGRACAALIRLKNDESNGAERTLHASMFEIYNEEINDLVDIHNKKLQLREKTNEGVYISGLTEIKMETVKEIDDLIQSGFQHRSTSSTEMNQVSSRSHCLVCLRLDQLNKSTGFLKSSKLNLVDLAGSEKVKKTGASGDRLKEASSINKSLSALGKIIGILSQKNMNEQAAKGSDTPKKGRGKSSAKLHIPYRDSKLTRILQNSLGGDAKTALLVALSPHDDNYEETISTLKFAQRARSIQNMTRVQGRKGSSFKMTSTSKVALVQEIEELNKAEVELKRLSIISNDPKYDAEKSAEKACVERALKLAANLCGKEALITPRDMGTEGNPMAGKYRRQRGRGNRGGRHR
jgi:hypothetical protein